MILTIIFSIISCKEGELELKNIVKIKLHDKTDSNLTISWNKVINQNIESLQLFRSESSDAISGGKLVKVIKGQLDTLYIDSTATLGTKYYYQLVAKPITGETLFSNVIDAQFGLSNKFLFPISKLMADPKRNHIYALVTIGDYRDNIAGGYGLVVIDSKTLQVTNRILSDHRFSDLTIDPGGDFMYLANGGRSIFKIDLSTLTHVMTFDLTNNASKLEIGTNGKIYYLVNPPISSSFGIFDLNSNQNITPNPFFVSSGDFELDLSTNNIIHGESNISTSCLRNISTANNSLLQLSLACINDGKDLLTLNQKKHLLFWKSAVYNIDMIKLGTFYSKEKFEENVLHASPNGEWAIGWRNLFQTSNQVVVKTIPTYYDKAIFLNDQQLILVRNTQPEYLKFETYIFKYTFQK